MNFTNNSDIMNFTDNSTLADCTCEDVYSTIEITVTAVLGAVALLSCPLGMLVGACLNQLARKKNDVKRTQVSIMEESELDTFLCDQQSRDFQTTPLKSEPESMQMKMEIIEKQLTMSSCQLKRSHSRKSLPPSPHERNEPIQRSNSVSYDEVDLAKLRSKYKIEERSIELKANQSYERTEKPPTRVAPCPLYSQTEAKSQQDLAPSHEYSEVTLKPKAMSVKVKPRRDREVEMKSNSSYGQLIIKAVSGGAKGQDPRQDYDYVEMDKIKPVVK